MPFEMVPATLTARPAARVLRAAELTPWLDGEAALDRANAEADAIIAATSARYEAESQRGYSDGSARAAIELAQALLVAHTTMEAALSEMEAALPELVLSIIQDILGTFDTSKLMQLALRRALERVRRSMGATLRVAPSSFDAARETLDELGLAGAVRLETDPVLEDGRCVFESSLGKAELGIAAQLRVLRETLADHWERAA